MADIRTIEELEEWLKKRPPEDAMILATRAALRVLPLWRPILRVPREKSSIESAAILLPFWHAVALAFAATKFPSQIGRMNLRVGQARNSVDNVSAFIGSERTRHDHAAFFSLRAAVDAADTVALRNQRSLVEIVSRVVNDSWNAEISAISSINRKRSVLDSTISDAVKLDEGWTSFEIAEERLWPNEIDNLYKENWRTMSRGLLEIDKDWSVWTRWYDGILNGQSTDSETVAIQRVSLDESFWLAGPQIVNSRLSELIAKSPNRTQLWDFFLSYAPENEFTARNIGALLESSGFYVFAKYKDIDSNTIKSSAVNMALNYSSRMILVLSPQYMSSDECGNERNEFISKKEKLENKGLMPILVLPSETSFLPKGTLVKANIANASIAIGNQRILAAVGPNPRKTPEEYRQEIKEAASPSPAISDDGKLTVTPAPIFQDPVQDDDLISLPKRVHAKIGILKTAFGSGNYLNYMMLQALAEIDEEFERNGLIPDVGVIRDCWATVEEFLHADGFKDQCNEIVFKEFEKLGGLISHVVAHYPLDPIRELLIATAPLDPAILSDGGFIADHKAMLAAIEALNRAGMATDEIVKAIKARQRVITELAALPKIVEGGDLFVADADRVQPPTVRKRLAVQIAGFVDGLLEKIDPLAKRVNSDAGKLLIYAAKTAYETVYKWFS